MGAEQGVPGMVHPAPELAARQLAAEIKRKEKKRSEGGKPMTERCTAAAAEMAAK